MLNYIWFGFLAFGFITGIINGRIEMVTRAALESAGKAVELSLQLLGIMCLWSGLMHIAEKSGLVRIIARAATPILKMLFPDVPENNPAMASIVMNLTANFLDWECGHSLGIRAMNELQKLNKNCGSASDAMCMFAVLNTAAVQLIPTTIIAIRAAAGSVSPSDVIGSIWLVSLCTVTSAVLSAIFFSRMKGRKRRVKWKQ